ncbi:stage V sporulation protein D [Cohnella sp. CIP 111063]|uniref:stage V sporulation protein D n=1 Tax=unclassified Cohnella TaxID=2636738 RepID=UPI000B8BDCBF|nr:MULTISPECIES: stage V sporulation protein D [unclassified Cohnella]OXS62444.1 stage V sporulation protein D [Cohnella sp. CIP 111063]PRX74684.1 stage V sporulation protein D (sporulation-specific penicillin-binding protein) [Cohnella sp. SGD-V74]
MKKISQVTVRKRLYIALVFAVFAFGALVIRLGYVQLWAGDEITKKAEDSWRRNIPFEAKRGEIVDRNGVRLAYNVSSPTIYAVPVQIKDKRGTAKQLAGHLGMSEDQLFKKLSTRASSVELKPGGRKITTEKAQEIRNLGLPGIMVTEDNKRYYPYGNMASHVLGFTGSYNQGLTGLELRYDQRLTGLRGSVSYLSDAAGRKMPQSSDQYVPPQDGLTLQLTIDQTIQSVVERELDQAVLQYQPDGVIAIAMNPNTGEIYAMGSRPTFEPDKYQEVSSEVYNRNLPIWMTYEPGSTFKIITLAAALEEKKVDLENERFYDPGHIEVAGAKLRCWKPGGHGSQTFLEVVENSCNPGFVTLGNRLGKELLFSYIHNFGFGKKTGIDLQGEENGILFKPKQVGPVELATTSFGQGVSVTPIQQITAVSAAINGGKLFKPFVSKSWIQPETGILLEETEPQLVRQVISEETSKKVRDALEKVVAQGTGAKAFLNGYRVGGKTGTAQKVVNGRYSKNEHIVSFIGFAPADDPQLIVYVAVDNPQGIQFGGVVAAPIVRNIMADALPYLGVQPRSTQVEKEYKYGEPRTVTVPNLVGKTVSDIYEDMNSNFQLSASGSGSTVVRQAPAAGARVEQGSVIRIYLGAAD